MAHPPMANTIDTPKHWRMRAEEARAIAETMTHPETKRVMLGIAESYEKLAKAAEARTSDKNEPDQR